MTISLKSKLQTLAEQNHKRDRTLPVISKGTNEWGMWRSWRQRMGLSVTFMDTCDRFTVPCELPPEDIDAALAESGPASRRLAR